MHPRSPDLVRDVVEFSRKERLFPEPGTVLVATSGGADSVALAAILDEVARERLLAIDSICLAHFDHAMRPDSARDREFVEALGERCNRRVVSERAAQGEEPTNETAARRARHAFLARAARGMGASVVALAHHAADQAETLLHRLLRGTGIRGLAGILPARQAGLGLRLVRPLLATDPEAIRAWLSERGLAWLEDPTNFDTSRARAFLRHRVLGARESERLYPAARSSLARLARRAREVEAYLEREARIALDRIRVLPPPPGTVEGRLWPGRLLGARHVTLDRDLWARLDPALVPRVAARAAAEIDATLATGSALEIFQEAVASNSRGDLDIPGGVRVLVEETRFHLIGCPTDLSGTEPRPEERPLVAGEPVLLDSLDLVLSARPGTSRDPLDRGPFAAVIDPGDAPIAPLSVRCRRPGDRYHPLGAPGAKKLADVMIDRKIPHAIRARLPVVALGGEPIWVPYLPPHEKVRVRPDSRHILVLELRST